MTPTKDQWLRLGAFGLGTAALFGWLEARRKRALGGIAMIVAPMVRYQLTPDDLLWLGRAINCESQHYPKHHAWAMIQRFCAFRQRAGWQPRSLRELVQAFSSPVNPKWLPGGELYKANPGHRAGSEAAQTLRRRCMNLQMEEFRPDVQVVIEDIAKGRSRNPVVGLTNFAACSAGAEGVNIGGNCFSAVPPVRGPVRLGG